MVVTALRGAIGFLTRIPVGRDEGAWEAFRQRPATLPAVGYLIGLVAALPLLVEAPPTSVAVGYAVWLYFLTGITHLDGVTDLGDALVVHGDPAERREVMTDTTVGVGGTLALVLVVIALVLAGVSLASLARASARTGVAIVVAAEVGAKSATATVVCLGEASHEGLGSALTEHTGSRSVIPVLVLAVPATLLDWPSLAPVATVAAAVVTAPVVLQVARSTLGGVSGDVLGATNELARVVALHAGVIAWTPS